MVNNVESIASVPFIIDHGADAFAALGTEKSKGFGIFSLSGHVTTPGQYEAPLGVTLRELLDLAGGVRAGHELKFWTPGGSSTPIFTDEHLDVPLDFEDVGTAGSMLGTRALQIFDDTACIVRATLRWNEFYEHESCGKCTPVPRGDLLDGPAAGGPGAGQGHRRRPGQAARHLRQHRSAGRSARSATARSARWSSSIKYFRDEYVEHRKRGGCPFDPAAATLFASEPAR